MLNKPFIVDRHGKDAFLYRVDKLRLARVGQLGDPARPGLQEDFALSHLLQLASSKFACKQFNTQQLEYKIDLAANRIEPVKIW